MCCGAKDNNLGQTPFGTREKVSLTDSSTQPKLFVRNATGMVREFSALDSLLIASGMVFALVFTTIQFPWFYGNTNGANMPLSLLIAAVPFAFLMIAYWAIGLAMPRTGSDYVWVSRIFSPSIGFAWSVLYMFVVFFVAYVGEIGSYGTAVSFAVTSSGIVSKSASVVNFGNFLSSPNGIFELAVLFTIIFGLFAVFGTKLVKGVIYGSWIAAVIGMILMWYILSTTTQATFVSNWNQMLVNNPVTGLGSNATYSSLYNTAVGLGAPSPTGTISAAVAALPLASLFLFGGNYISGFAGEIKNVKKSVPIALFLSLIFGVIYWTVTSALTLHTVGSSWMTAVGWNWDNNAANAAKYALPFPPSQPLVLAVSAYGNTPLIYLMFGTYIIGSIAPLFAYFWIPTRYFFAWSFDRAVPSKFSDMSSRFNTPYFAVTAIVVLGIVLSYFYSLSGWSASFTVGSVVWGIAYVIPGLALMVFPFVKKDLFAQAPGFVKAKIGGLPLMTIIGLITAASFAYIGYIGYLNPAVTNTAYALFGLELLGGVVVVSFIVYFVSKYYYKGRGVDISLAFKEIPPE
jgi:basic amino acid/polyamine antiporter, APA family